ncbi:MAG: hypothetical protein WBG43_03365 [Marinifilaceae bacterium]
MVYVLFFRLNSYDYCYNYFASHKGQALLDGMEKSCLVLGFYLASWGIYTFDFLTGQRSQVKYTKAKIIDMYGFNRSSLAKKDAIV